MKRKNASLRALCLLAVVLLALPLFAGCHGHVQEENTENTENTQAEFEVPEAFDESKEIALDFWAKNDTNKNQVLVYEKAAEDFSKLYPNVKVTIRFYTDYQKIYQDVITNIPTNTTPNVCISYPDHIATYITGQDIVVPLDTLIDNEKYGFGGSELKFDCPTKDELITEFFEEGKLSGKYYQLPYMRSSEACYINKTYLEKLGYELPEMLTWDFIWEVSEKATEKDENGIFKVNGQEIMIPFIYKSADNMTIQYLFQKQAGYSTESGEVLYDNEVTRDFLKECGQHAKTGAFSTFDVSGYPANFLNAGQCIFAIDSTAGATWMGADAPLSDIPEDKKVDFELAVMPVPQADPEKPLMISQGPSICIFNKDDPQVVLASWMFCEYLLSNDVQIPYAKTEGYVPVTSKARESAEYKDYLAKAGADNDEHYSAKIEATELVLNYTANTFITPVFNGSASLRTASKEIVNKAVKSARRKEEITDEYLDKLFNDMNTMYHLDETEQ